MEKPQEDVPFEQAFQQLEQLVKNMESDRMPLDQLVDHYERGNRLLKTCQQRLREAEQRIEQIASGKAGGLEAFDASSASPESSPRKSAAIARKNPSGEEDGGAADEIQLF